MPIRVPKYEGSVQTQALPGVKQNIQAPADAFGVGLGDAVSKAGTTMLKIEKKEYDDAQNVQLFDADRELGEWENQRLWGEGGAMTKEGKDAFDVPEQVREDYSKKLAELRARFTDPNTLMKFEKLAVGRERGINRAVQRKIAGEIQKYEDAVTESTLKSAQSNAVANYNDPMRIGIEIDRQLNVLNEHGKRNGWPTKVMEHKRAQVISSTHTAVLERMLANDEDQLAQAYFRDNKEGFSGEDVAKVEKALEASKLRGESQRKADAIIMKTDDYDAQLDQVKKIKDPKLRDEVEQRLVANNSRRTQAESKRQRQAKDSAWQTIVAGVENDKGEGVPLTSTDQIPVHIWSRLSGPDQQQIVTFLKKQASGDEIETHWPTYYRLAMMSGTELGKVDLNDYRNNLSNAEFKQVTGWQRAQANAAEKGVSPEGSTGQLIKATLEETPLPDDQKGRFTQRVFSTIDEEQQAKKRKLTTIEKQQIIDRLLVEGEVDSGKFSIFAPSTWTDPDKRAFDVIQGEEAQRFYISDVPDVERQKIKQALEEANEPVTDNRIMELYNLKVQQTIMKGQ